MEIYAVNSNYRIDENHFRALMKLLSYEEAEKIKKYHRWEDAQRGLVGRISIRSLICNKYKIKNEDIYFNMNEYGKPYFKGIKDFHFNISHSGEWIVYAVDKSPIGIDVEKVADIDLSIAERFFSKEECMDLMKIDKRHRLAYFFDLWSLKESYIKAEGKGLSISLDSFSIKIRGKLIDAKGANRRYYFKQYNDLADYKLSICALNNNFPDDINIIGLEEFVRYSINYLGGS